VNLIEISIKRPVFAWVLMFALQPTEWQRVAAMIFARSDFVNVLWAGHRAVPTGRRKIG
jgi:hypothetical protein